MLAVTGGKAMWYLTRGTGMMALLLLTASMLLGIVEVKRWQSSRWPRFVTAALHAKPVVAVGCLCRRPRRHHRD